MKPLAIDLFSGVGGWTEGLLAEGYDVVGFDIERHVYGDARYPAQLVLQDVRTLHGSQFRDAALIVASPPCQEYSYMAMPWSRAKQIEREYLDGTRDRAKQDGDEFERRMDAFLRPLDLMHLQTQPFDFPRYAASTACFHMIYGRSARGCSHAVVAMNGKVIHDPHFDKRGLTEGDAQVWAFLVRRCGG